MDLDLVSPGRNQIQRNGTRARDNLVRCEIGIEDELDPATSRTRRIQENKFDEDGLAHRAANA